MDKKRNERCESIHRHTSEKVYSSPSLVSYSHTQLSPLPRLPVLSSIAFKLSGFISLPLEVRQAIPIFPRKD